MKITTERLKSLIGCGDAAHLRSAVGELCAEVDEITRIDSFTIAQNENRQALFLLHLASARREQELVSSLGASRFGEDLLVIVDLRANEAAH